MSLVNRYWTVTDQQYAQIALMITIYIFLPESPGTFATAFSRVILIDSMVRSDWTS